MINKISNNIADYFFENKMIERNDKDLYIYGLQLIISSLIGIATILCICIILNKFIDSIIFLLCFIILRNYCGGYHANSYLKCNLYFIGIFIITELIIMFTPIILIEPISVVIFCTSLYILVKYAPVDNVNKKLSKIQKDKSRVIALMNFTVLVVIAGILKFIGIYYFYNIIVTIFSTTALMIIQIKRKGNNKWVL